MAYSAFNSQGPQVSVSLFGDAATRGIAMGQNLPSVASSIVQGVKSGLDYEQKYETQEINNRNNTAVADINEVRAANAQALTDQDLERNQLINKEAELKLQIQQATFTNDLKLKVQETENSLIQKNNEKLYLDQESEITKIMTSGDAGAIANAATDGRLAAYWDKNKEAQKQIILQNKDRYQGDQKAIAENILYSSVDEAIRKAAVAATFKGSNSSEAEKKYQDAFSKSAFPAILNTLITPKDRVDAITKGVLVPMNSIDIAADGSYTLRSGAVDLGGKEGTYAMVVEGKVIGQNITSAQQQAQNEALQYIQAGYGDPIISQLYQQNSSARNIFAPKEAMQTPSDALKTPVIDQKRKELEERRKLAVQQPQEQAVKEGLAQGPQLPPEPPRKPLLDRGLEYLGEQANKVGTKFKEEAKKNFDIKTKDLFSTSDSVVGVPEAKANDMQAYQNQQPIDVSKIEPLYSVQDLPEKERKLITDAKKARAKIDKVEVVVRNEAKLKQIIPDLPGVNGVDLVKSVIAVESNGNINAKSGTGVVGIMQLTEAAAKDVKIPNRYDPDQNLLGGAMYLNMMLKRFDNNIEHALLAYNGGASVIAKAISEVGEDTTDIISYLRRAAKRNKNAYPNLDKIKEMEKYPEKVLTQLAALKYSSNEAKA